MNIVSLILLLILKSQTNLYCDQSQNYFLNLLSSTCQLCGSEKKVNQEGVDCICETPSIYSNLSKGLLSSCDQCGSSQTNNLDQTRCLNCSSDCQCSNPNQLKVDQDYSGNYLPDLDCVECEKGKKTDPET